LPVSEYLRSRGRVSPPGAGGSGTADRDGAGGRLVGCSV
jgi:hypothetical protein